MINSSEKSLQNDFLILVYDKTQSIVYTNKLDQLFKSRDDFINCKQLKIKKDVNAVGKSLQNVDSYVSMKFEDGVWKRIK